MEFKSPRGLLVLSVILTNNIPLSPSFFSKFSSVKNSWTVTYTRYMVLEGLHYFILLLKFEIKFSILLQVLGYNVLIVLMIGYSFSISWISRAPGEEAELLYHVLSLGTLERLAPEWMREDIMFSPTMCPIFFERVTRVINLKQWGFSFHGFKFSSVYPPPFGYGFAVHISFHFNYLDYWWETRNETWG